MANKDEENEWLLDKKKLNFVEENEIYCVTFQNFCVCVCVCL